MGKLNWNQFGDAGDFHTAEMDRVMSGDRMALPSRDARAGEWDTLRNYPQHTIRSLRGAGYFVRGGIEPDVAATHRIGPATGHDDTDSAMDWYVKTAQGAIAERRVTARRTRDKKWAAERGYKTPYQRRQFEAIEAGYEGYGHMAKERGWGRSDE